MQPYGVQSEGLGRTGDWPPDIGLADRKEGARVKEKQVSES